MFTALWVIWVLAFFVIEGIALARKESGDTLSEHVWAMLKHPVAWFTGLGSFAWLGVHFFCRCDDNIINAIYGLGAK
jgi:hypothetical protein